MPTITQTEENQTTEMSARSKRSLGEDVYPAPGHSRAEVPADFRTINGWGADLDPSNRPSYPKELPSTVNTVRGEVKDWQVPRHPVHLSNEHPNLTPVFGTACPPKGLSGLLRDYAFQFGEATNRHWMTLMLADRIDVAESLGGGLLSGHPDRFIEEKGWKANLRYADRDRTRQYAMIGVAAAAGIALALTFGSSRRGR